MMAHLRGEGIMGESVLHAVQVEPDLWHGVDLERTGGVSVYTRETLITRIADLIGKRHLHALTVGSQVPVIIDRAGNTWIDHEYLAPHEYLPRLIK